MFPACFRTGQSSGVGSVQVQTTKGIAVGKPASENFDTAVARASGNRRFAGVSSLEGGRKALLAGASVIAMATALGAAVAVVDITPAWAQTSFSSTSGPVTLSSGTNTVSSGVTISGGPFAVYVPGPTTALTIGGVISTTAGTGVFVDNGGSLGALTNSGSISGLIGINVNPSGTITRLDNSGGTISSSSLQGILIQGAIGTLPTALSSAWHQFSRSVKSRRPSPLPCLPAWMRL